MKNPFFPRENSHKDPFFLREQSLIDLCDHGRACANVVLHSPRRYGKTSLAKRVQSVLAQEGAITAYCQFYGVVSEEDVAIRIAKSIFSSTQGKESLFRKVIRFFNSFRQILATEPNSQIKTLWNVQLAKAHLSGLELLEEVLTSLDKFIEEAGVPIHIVFDEFQEITELPKSGKIEELLREHIRKQKASYLFVGSRRSLLLSMFNEQTRPFYNSVIHYPLDPLSEEDFAKFIIQEFLKAGKICEESAAKKIVSLIECYPYYGQKLAHIVFDVTQETATESQVDQGMNQLLQEERPVFEGILMGLTPPQISILTALSKEPKESIYAQNYLKRHRLGSIGGVQAAVKKLSHLDLIEKHSIKGWKVVDPILARWLLNHGEF